MSEKTININKDPNYDISGNDINNTLTQGTSVNTPENLNVSSIKDFENPTSDTADKYKDDSNNNKIKTQTLSDLRKLNTSPNTQYGSTNAVPESNPQNTQKDYPEYNPDKDVRVKWLKETQGNNAALREAQLAKREKQLENYKKWQNLAGTVSTIAGVIGGAKGYTMPNYNSGDKVQAAQQQEAGLEQNANQAAQGENEQMFNTKLKGYEEARQTAAIARKLAQEKELEEKKLQTNKDIAGIQAGSRENVAGMNIGAKLGVADKNLEGRKYTADQALEAAKYRSNKYFQILYPFVLFPFPDVENDHYNQQQRANPIH